MPERDVAEQSQMQAPVEPVLETDWSPDYDVNRVAPAVQPRPNSVSVLNLSGISNAARARTSGLPGLLASTASIESGAAMGNAVTSRTAQLVLPPFEPPQRALDLRDGSEIDSNRDHISSRTPESAEAKAAEAKAADPKAELKPVEPKTSEGPGRSGTEKSQPITAPVTPSAEASTAGEALIAPAPVAAITAHDPGGILSQLAATPPSAALSAMDQAEQSTAEALSGQRQEAEQRLPEMAAPTGLPPRPDDGAETAKQDPADTSTAATPEIAPAAVSEDGPAGSTVEIPEVPPVSETTLVGPKTSSDADDDAAEQAEFEARARQAMEWVGADQDKIDRVIPTTFGSRPTVGVSQATDPSRVDEQRGPADAATARAKADAGAGINADHGLGAISPEPTDARLSAKRPLSVAGSAMEPGGGPGSPLPSDVASDLDHSLGAGLGERLGAKRDEYAEGERQYEADSDQAHRDTQAEISRLTANATRDERAHQRQAGDDVEGYQQQWSKELDDTEADYHKQAGAAVKTQRDEIEKKRVDGDQRAHAEIDKAEHQAAEAKIKSDKEAEQEKAKKREESHGFFGWVRSKAAALIDLLKKAINAIYDRLRKAVKGFFELAKRVALGIINAVRSAIVGLIRGFGAILKGLVSLALIAFPKTAKRINALIDKAVDTAVEKVNAIADKLQSVVASALDFLANTIDKLLGLVQSLYNGLLTVIGMLIRGELKELMERFANLVAAARDAPGRFEAAAYEELLGGDFEQPLSPMELLQAGVSPPGLGTQSLPEAGGAEPAQALRAADAGVLPSKPFTEANVGVDEIVTGAELSAEVQAEAEDRLADQDNAVIAEANSPDRSLDAIMKESSLEPRKESAAPALTSSAMKLPSDGLDPRGRAAVRWKLMKEGLANWFDQNKVAIIAGTVAALLALAALIFFSGGSILAAIGPIMLALGPIFVGATVATIAGHVQDFVINGWEGRREQGSKSLAKAAAAGAVELLSYLTFKAGGAALRGAKFLAKATFKGVATVARAGFKGAVAAGGFIARGARFIISKGKVLLQGAKGFIAKNAKRLRELGEQLLARLRIKKVRLVVHGTEFEIQGYINPWIVILRGEVAIAIKKVGKGTKKAFELEERMLAKLTRPGKAGELVRKLKMAGSELLGTRKKLGRFPANYRYAGEQLPLSKALAKKYPKGVRFNRKGFPTFPKEYQKAAVKIRGGFAGNHTTDFADAWKALSKKTGKTVAALKKELEATHTWHHVEDGKTMQLVPWDLHDGVRHSGGVAATKALAGK